MSKSTKWIIGAVAIIVAVSYFVSKLPSQQSTQTIKIGLILPLTGEIASLGENAKNGADLAYNELPKKLKQRIQLIFEDDGFQPKNTVSAFNKLVEGDKVDVVVCFTSGPCSAIAPLADQKKIPLIAISSAPVQKDREFVIRLEVSTKEEAKKLSQFIKEKDYTKIASVVAIQDGIRVGYTELLNDSNFSIKEVISESVRPDEKDFKTIITKLVSKKPDLVFVGLLPGMAGEFGKQMRILGYKGDFIGFNFIEGEETLVSAQGALDGIVYTQASDTKEWFAEKYKRIYDKSIGPGSAHVYDAIGLVINAVRNNTTNRTEINQSLNNIKNFHGALGEYSSNGSHEFTLPLILKTIRNNKFVSY